VIDNGKVSGFVVGTGKKFHATQHESMTPLDLRFY